MTLEPSTECVEQGVANLVFDAPAAAPLVADAPSKPRRHKSIRRLLRSIVLLTGGLLFLRTLILEPYNVPTGSMAPVLAGIHKATDCPRCGYPVLVGRRDEKGDTQASQLSYAAACCPNCGHANLGLDTVPECAGDHLLVDKTIFEFRRPHRWELTVFRFPNDPQKPYIKRVVGLPGELVQVRGGDLFIDKTLCRKSLEEVKRLRVPVFDNNYQPKPNGWRKRWVAQPPSGPVYLDGSAIRLDATQITSEYQLVVYHHYALDERRETAVCDIYGYNGGDPNVKQEPVHDFMIDCDVEVLRGTGWIGFDLTDGLDWMRAELRVGPAPHGTYGTCLSDSQGPIRTAPSVHLEPGKSYHVEFAFVDRRATLAIDGRCPFPALDLLEVEQRFEVKRPAKIGALGVEVVVRNFRLFRDIHYTQAGQHGTRSPLRLQAGEYFVLGDNSPNSDDSRFWPSPVVPEANFLGKPVLIHMPSRVVYKDGEGGRWRAPDWGRMRWLH